jgi:hypothetical protein
MLKYYSSILILLLITSGNSFALDGPSGPKDPSVEFNFNGSNEKTFPVEIDCAGIQKINGKIYLKTANISFVNNGEKLQIKIEDLKSIEFLEWREKADENNSFIFIPSKVFLEDKKGHQYDLNELPEFNMIEYSENSKRKKMYAYFYDYWKNGKWQNSGTEDRSYPLKNPLQGTMLKIIFIESNDTINDILKILTK